MEPIRKQGKDELLDALTMYYARCREITETGGSDNEYLSCRLKIDSILRELNDRRTSGSPADRDNSPLGDFRRQSSD